MGQLSSLRDYVAVVRRRKWIVVQAAIIVPVLAIVLSLRQDALYSSSAEVLLTRQSLALTLTGTADPLVAQAPERLLETQSRLAKVPEIAIRVVKAARIRDRSAAAVLGQIGVQPREGSDFLVFSAVDRDPAFAARLVNAYALEYVRYKRFLDTSTLARARGKAQREIRRLERKGKRNSAVYETLIEKRQQLETIEALQTANASLVRPAGGAVKISPRPKRNAVLGLGLGLMLGLGIAFLLDALDTRVRSSTDIERILGLPLLARLPRPPRELEKENRLVILADPRSRDAEAIRILRTNFEFLNLDLGAHTVLITSSVAEEGKSTTIANLAVALATAGHRVSLVDLDLRRPTLHRFFGLSGKGGVSDVGSGRMQIEAVPFDPGETFEGRAGSIQVLTTRPARTDTAELIGSAELEEILQTLRDESDFVLVDGPPMLLVGDAMQLTAKVDAILVVARLGIARRPVLMELRRSLESCPAAKLGFVLAGSESDYDYHYEYSSYYYGQPAGKQAPK